MSKRHVLYDIWLEDPFPLERVDPWPALLHGAAERGHATILGEQFHQFEPWGASGFLLLAESHISVHTWPEEGLAVIDIFACGRLDIDIIVDYLRQALHPCRERLTSIERGI